MNNYAIDKKSKEYTIIETKTGHQVYTGMKKREAYKHLTFLNMGGAFDGWTPNFFLVKMPEYNYPEVE
jgi:hypothetical protein